MGKMKGLDLFVQESPIKPGDYVRSYDFDHTKDCYVEGTVEEIGVMLEGCPRYRIRVDKRVWDGKEATSDFTEGLVFPPMNGVPKLMGGECKGVVPLGFKMREESQE